MTHLLDTTALLAHYLAEKGGSRVQELFENDSCITGASVLSFYEFELRLHILKTDAKTRINVTTKYKALLDEVVDIDLSVISEALRLRISATSQISAIDTLIASCASLNGATLVHRDPHFGAIPSSFLKQEVLPPK